MADRERPEYRFRCECGCETALFYTPPKCGGCDKSSGARLIGPTDGNTCRFSDGCLEYPGGGMNLAMLRALLLPAGYRIDRCDATQETAQEHGYRLIGPAEVAVLAASAKAPESELKLVVSMGGHPSWEREHAQAELARRGGGG